MFITVAYTAEPLSRGHPRDQSKCPLNGVRQILTNEYFLFLFFCLGIFGNHYFKQLDNV